MEFVSGNIIALCYACHIHFWHKNPIEAHDWLKQKLPDRMKKLKLIAQKGMGSRDYKQLRTTLRKELNELREIT
jgi:hypothetical protein